MLYCSSRFRITSAWSEPLEDTAWKTPSRMSSASPKSGDVTLIAIISTSDSQYHPQSASLAFHQNETYHFPLHSIHDILPDLVSCHLAIQSFWISFCELWPWRKMSSIGSHRLCCKLQMLLDWVYDKLVGPWPMNHTFQIWHISLNDERKIFYCHFGTPGT